MMGQDFDARRANHAARWGAASGAASAPAPAPAHNQVSLSPAEKRFDLSMSAPITMSSLRTRLGFLSDTDFTNSLLTGDVHIPWDVDDVTATVLEEVIRLFGLLREGHGVVDITADHFRYYWRRFKEQTLSSISGIHAGHYKSATHSDTVTNFLARKITLIARGGCENSSVTQRSSYG